MIPLSTSGFVCGRRLLTPALNHLLMASSGWNWSIAGPSSSILIESFRVVMLSRLRQSFFTWRIVLNPLSHSTLVAGIDSTRSITERMRGHDPTKTELISFHVSVVRKWSTEYLFILKLQIL